MGERVGNCPKGRRDEAIAPYQWERSVGNNAPYHEGKPG